MTKEKDRKDRVERVADAMRQVRAGGVTDEKEVRHFARLLTAELTAQERFLELNKVNGFDQDTMTMRADPFGDTIRLREGAHPMVGSFEHIVKTYKGIEGWTESQKRHGKNVRFLDYERHDGTERGKVVVDVKED